MCSKSCSDYGIYINNYYQFLKHDSEERVEVINTIKQSRLPTGTYILTFLRDIPIKVRYDFLRNIHTIETSEHYKRDNNLGVLA